MIRERVIGYVTDYNKYWQNIRLLPIFQNKYVVTITGGWTIRNSQMLILKSYVTSTYPKKKFIGQILITVKIVTTENTLEIPNKS